MKRVRLHLPPGGVHPVYGLLTESPHVDRAEAISWHVTDGGVLTMLHRIVGDTRRVDSALAEIDLLRTHETILVRGTTDEAYVFLRDVGTSDSRDLFRAISAEGLLTIPPIEYDETGARFTVVGEDRSIQRVLTAVPDRFEIEIERIGDSVPALETEAALSDRQREAARVGVDLGYFDVPRRASHEDVAEVLGCSPSTAAEHLQKAQSRIVKRTVE